MVKKLRLTISLNGILPPIFRELELPSNMNGSDFADLVQLAMGWKFEHLYEFHAGKKVYTDDENEMYPDMGSKALRGRTRRQLSLSDITVRDLLSEAREAKATLSFVYDFGDWWEHSILLDEVSEYAEGESHEAKLINGKRACPPEDCGGVPGYMDLVEAMGDPTSEHAMELIDWLGHKYNPNIFPKKRTGAKIALFNQAHPPKD